VTSVELTDQPVSLRRNGMTFRDVGKAQHDATAIDARVERGCLVRARSPHCMSKMSCDNQLADGTLGNDGLDTSLAADTLDPDSGDLLCADQRQVPRAALPRADAPVADLLERCLSDLAAFAALPPPPTRPPPSSTS
jgi:hypothetical protein